MTTFEVRNENGLGLITTPKYYVAGLGYSPSSAGPVGGAPTYGFQSSPSVYSSTFFGSDVKGLLPQFGRRRSKTPGGPWRTKNGKISKTDIRQFKKGRCRNTQGGWKKCSKKQIRKFSKLMKFGTKRGYSNKKILGEIYRNGFMNIYNRVPKVPKSQIKKSLKKLIKNKMAIPRILRKYKRELKRLG